jgi:polyhydroxybutyrate depolymerase
MRPLSLSTLVAAGAFTLVGACSDNASTNTPASNAVQGSGGSAGGSSMQETVTAGASGSSTTELPETDAGSAGAGGGDVGASDAAAPNLFDGATPPSGKSMGCGKEVHDDPTKWVEHDLMVKVDPEFAAMYTSRKYFTRVPKNYDPNKAYPVTFWGHGCGASGAENTPLMAGGANDNSIQVFLLAIGGCFSTSKANSPELPYFDDALAGIEENYCVDQGKVFMSGYSSGGWLSYLLGCARAGIIRGIGAASGGWQVDRPACTGPIAAILTADTSDMTNPIMNIDKATGIDKGTGAARDAILKRNGCSTDTKPWDQGDTSFQSSTCTEYQGCLPGFPVVWCQTSGQGHSDGASTGISSKAFWTFWSALP